MSIITVDFDGTLYQHNLVMTTLKVGKTMFTFKQWVYIVKDIVKSIVNKTAGREIGFHILFLESFFLQMKGKDMEELHNFFVSLIETDIPLLEFADKAIVVRPSDALKKVAELKGWETFAPLQETKLKG